MHLTFGEWLRDRRKAMGLTQGDLAGRVGLTQAQVSRFESGLQKATADAVRPLIEAVKADTTEAEYWLQRMEQVRTPAPKPTLLPSRRPVTQPSRVMRTGSVGDASMSRL